MFRRNGRPGGERGRADEVGVPGGQTDVLPAVRHGGELSGVVRVPPAADGHRLAPDHAEAVAVHSENHQRRHRTVPAGRAQTSVAVPPVSHVRITRYINVVINNNTVLCKCRPASSGISAAREGRAKKRFLPSATKGLGR